MWEAESEAENKLEKEDVRRTEGEEGGREKEAASLSINT